MKQKLKRALIVVLVLCVVGEIGVRIYNAMRDRPLKLLSHQLILKKDYWHLTPNLKIYHPSRLGDIRYTFNKQGFRTKDHTKTSKKHRILILGDSISFGISVNDDLTYPALLEKQLNEKGVYPQGVEFINLAVFAFGGSEQVYVAKKFGFPLKPNAVFLQIYMNDFFKRKSKAQKRKESSLYQRVKGTIGVLWLAVMGRSALYIRVRQWIHMGGFWLVHDWRRRNPEHLNAREPKEQAALFRNNKPEQIGGLDHILKIRDMAKSRGLPFAVMVSPHETQLFFKKYDIINKVLHKFCKQHGIRLLDPLPMLRKAEKGKIYTDGLHYSVYGNQLLSAWLAKRWAEVMKPAKADQPSKRPGPSKKPMSPTHVAPTPPGKAPKTRATPAARREATLPGKRP